MVITGLIGTLVGNLFVVWKVRSAGFRYRVDFGGTSRIVVNGVAAGVLGAGVMWAAGSDHVVAGSLGSLVAIVFAFAALCLVNRPIGRAEWDILVRLLPSRLRRKASD